MKTKTKFYMNMIVEFNDDEIDNIVRLNTKMLSDSDSDSDSDTRKDLQHVVDSIGDGFVEEITRIDDSELFATLKKLNISQGE